MIGLERKGNDRSYSQDGGFNFNIQKQVLVIDNFTKIEQLKQSLNIQVFVMILVCSLLCG